MNIGQVDTSSLGNNISLRDAQVKDTLENQKIDAGNTANAQAKTVYAAQVLTGALASGDPTIYNQAKSHLGDMGFDTSGLAADIPTATAQVNALRQAQYSANPLNALLGLGIKAEGNLPNAPLSSAVSSALSGGGGGASLPGAIRPIVQAPAPGAGAAPAPEAAAAPQTEAQAAFANQYKTTAGAPPPLTTPPPSAYSTAPLPGESKTMYEARISHDPSLIASDKSAEALGTKTGDEKGDLQKALNVAVSNMPAVVQRMGTVIANADNSSYGTGVNKDNDGLAQEYANTAAGQYFEPGRAMSNELMTKAIAQGVLPEIGTALSNNNMKGNKYLETLSNNALGIDVSAPNDVKKSLALQNLVSYTSQVRSLANQARALGQPAPSDADIDAMYAAALQKAGVDPSKISQGAQAAPAAAATPQASSVGASQAFINLKNKGYSDEKANAILQQSGLR